MIDSPSQDLTVCWKCGARALPGQEFADGERTGQVLCPNCRQRVTRHSGIAMLAGAGAVIVTGLLLVWLGKGDDLRAGWVTLNIGIGWCMGLLLTIPHELAHAAVAALFRHRIKRIVIGYGATMARINAGFPIEWRLVPLGGFCEHVARDGRHRRAASFWIAAAGPGSHLFMGLGAWLLAGRPGFDQFDPTRGLTLLWLFIGWNAAGFFWNAWPSTTTIEGTNKVPNDGLLMVRSLSKEEPAPAAGPAPPVDTRKPAPLVTRLALWGGALAGVIGAVLQLSAAQEGHPLPRSAALIALGWLAVTALCVRGAMFLEDAANRPPPSRRIAAGTTVHAGFYEILRRELAAAPRGENPAALDAALKDIAVLIGRGDWPAAIARCDEAIQAAGPHPALLFWRAHSLTEGRRDDEAQAAWSALYDADLTGPALAAMTVAGFTLTCARTGRVQELISRVEDYAAFEQSTPARLFALDHAARCTFTASCPALAGPALSWTAELLDASPKEPAFLAVDGVVRVIAGQAAGAAGADAQLKEALRLAEDPAIKGLAHGGLALAARARGDERAARKHLDRAELLLPGEPWLKDLRG